ncbi:MAG: Asp-tRNA(Asn)/Glu-tRNA(Gln) amidotransferase subunit GatC [Mycoplasmoidaceae bacterium]|nr:Asp-tRNA(Asn)/Glu-tRNA(Gln) amidotransferase subunit GatC [Mycoplasmoidaceae bacterium]
MTSISKQEIKEIAKNYYFNLDEQTLDSLYQDFQSFLTNLEALEKIDTTNVEPTDYCTPFSCNCLRKDIPEIEQNPEEFTKNAKNKFNKYIVIK